MSQPVTTRLPESSVSALDRAVAAGLGSSRAVIVAEAVEEWLSRHSEDAITASYERRYGSGGTPTDDDLVARLSAFSVSACLPNER